MPAWLRAAPSSFFCPRRPSESHRLAGARVLVAATPAEPTNGVGLLAPDTLSLRIVRLARQELRSENWFFRRMCPKERLPTGDT